MGYSAYLLRVQDVVLQSYLSRTVYQELSIKIYLLRARSSTEVSIEGKEYLPLLLL